MERANTDEGLEKYVKYSVDELVVLRESYKARINSKINNHWITKLERKYNRDIRILIRKLALFLIILGMLPISIVMIVMIFNPTLASIIVQENDRLIMLPLFIFTMFGAFIQNSIDDKTSQLRKELRNIELVLEKKHSPDKKIMVDSNIANDIQSGKITRKEIEKAKAQGYIFYITHIQNDEIGNVENPDLRQQLLAHLLLLNPVLIDTHSTVEGLSRFGFSDIKRGEILRLMTENKTTHKKFKDALIAETSIERDLTLLTNDDRLRAAVIKLNGRTKTLDEFKNKLSDLI